MCKQYLEYWDCPNCGRNLTKKVHTFETCDEAYRRGAPGRCRAGIRETKDRHTHTYTCHAVLGRSCRGEHAESSSQNRYVEDNRARDWWNQYDVEGEDEETKKKLRRRRRTKDKCENKLKKKEDEDEEDKDKRGKKDKGKGKDSGSKGFWSRITS